MRKIDLGEQGENGRQDVKYVGRDVMSKGIASLSYWEQVFHSGGNGCH